MSLEQLLWCRNVIAVGAMPNEYSPGIRDRYQVMEFTAGHGIATTRFRHSMQMFRKERVNSRRTNRTILR